MFVELPAKKDFAPLGAKQTFRSFGAGSEEIQILQTFGSYRSKDTARPS